MLTEKIFDTGTIKINYAEGAPNSTPLVMLHGGTAHWQELMPLITELEKDWHIYACDARGHGKSSWGFRWCNP
jgi:pimeloyl-ACP methyl ester carboxylesterase